MFRSIALLCLAAFATHAGAQGQTHLVFPDAKSRMVFESSNEPESEPKSFQQIAGDAVDFKIASKNDKDRLYVVDQSTGNVISKPLGEVRLGNWAVNVSDAQAAYLTHVAVKYNGDPVASASVELKDGLRTQTVLLSPSNKGIATFYFVRFGDLNVTVKYNSNGKPAKPIEQTFSIEAKRDVADPTFTVALPEVSDTVPVSGSTGATKSGDTPSAGSLTTKDAGGSKGASNDGAISGNSPTGSNPITNILTTLIGLAVAGALIYGGFQYMKANPDKVKDVLTKLGADVPKPPEPANDPVVQAPRAPEPVTQIILDPSGPDPIAGTSSAGIGGTINLGTVVSAPTGIPTLVATDGSRFEIPDGETTVGREMGVGLVVPHDTISRNHASLIKSGTEVEIRDAGSTNGTWINQVKLNGSSILRGGDSVRFGAVEFRFEA